MSEMAHQPCLPSPMPVEMDGAKKNPNGSKDPNGRFIQVILGFITSLSNMRVINVAPTPFGSLNTATKIRANNITPYYTHLHPAHLGDTM